MSVVFLSFACRLAPAWLLMTGLVFPAAVRAAGSGQDPGPRLLQAQLPAGLSIQQADCDHLVRAVRAATLAHHQAAEAILSAALATADDNGRPAAATERACPCVARLFRAAVNAAPDHARTLLEAAEALCPDCAAGLTEALQRLSDKNVVADPSQARNESVGPNDAGRARGAGNTGDAGSAGNTGNAGSAGTAGNPGSSGDPGDPDSVGYQGLSQRDFRGLDLPATGTGDATGTTGTDSSANGFGVGPGTGFPGAPGFSGSVSGGGTALPLPASAASSAATNR